MGCALRLSLRESKKGQHWEDLVDYTCDELKEHLESLFTNGMTWKKFLNGEIHIDHVYPISHFRYESADELAFKLCWAIENLQPLWAKDNLSKGNRYIGRRTV